jgi:hypothetical protein
VIERGVTGIGALAGYERLRSCALGEAVGEPGLALLMRRGLRAWIEARGDVTTNVTAAPIATAASGGYPAGDDVRDELARLVVTMVLGAARREARA